MPAILAVLGFLVGACGGYAYWVLRKRNTQAQADAMTEDQRAWYDAESDYFERLKQANAAWAATASSGDAAIAQSEKTLAQARLLGTRPLGSAGGISLFEDRIQTPAGVFAFDGRKASATAKATGSLRVLKSGTVKDTRKLQLRVRTPLFESTVLCNPNQQAGVEQLAFAVGNAAAGWAQAKAAAAKAIAEHEVLLRTATAKRDADNASAQAALAHTTGDRASVDAVRGVTETAYCPRCQANVLVVDGGGCVKGHGAGVCEPPRDGAKPALPGKRVRTGETPAMAAAALGLILLLVGVAVAGAQPAPPTSVASPAAGSLAVAQQSLAAVEPSAATEPTSVALRPAQVVNVVDGDTADVVFEDGAKERVRFIGVDTPESTTQTEPYGAEASGYTKAQLLNKTVFIETDAELRDNYGRLLAYVWVAAPSGASDSEIRTKMFNARLALDGYAQQMTIQPNSKYADYFTKYVAEARDASRGLWAPAPVAPPVVVAPAPAPEPEPSDPAVTYIGNKNTRKFHYADCYSVDQMKASNKVTLKSRAAAIKAGYVPCKNCNP